MTRDFLRQVKLSFAYSKSDMDQISDQMTKLDSANHNMGRVGRVDVFDTAFSDCWLLFIIKDVHSKMGTKSVRLF